MNYFLGWCWLIFNGFKYEPLKGTDSDRLIYFAGRILSLLGEMERNGRGLPVRIAKRVELDEIAGAVREVLRTRSKPTSVRPPERAQSLPVK